MSQQDDTPRDEIPREDAARIRDQLRTLPPRVPHPAFRARVKEKFLSPAVSIDADRARLRRMAAVRVGAAGLAAAAVLLVALLGVPGSPAWRLAPTGINQEVLVDGAPLSPGIPGGASVSPESRITNLGPGEIRLEVTGAMVCVLAPGSEIRVGVSGGRFRSELHAELTRGTLMGTTQDAFPRAGLRITTGDVEAHITGTTFSVMKDPDSTCVCVLEGTVLTRAPNTEQETPVAAGIRLTAYTDGRRLQTDPLLPREATILEQLRDSGRRQRP